VDQGVGQRVERPAHPAGPVSQLRIEPVARHQTTRRATSVPDVERVQLKGAVGVMLISSSAGSVTLRQRGQ
jgi:hypothetical protein